MNPIKFNLESTLSVWWAMIWRTVLASAVGGAFAGAVVGFIATSVGRPEQATLLGAIVGWIVSIPASIWALKAALTQSYSGSSVYLMTVSPETHVKCPDCRALVPREARKCMQCGCTLIPQ